MNGMAMEESLWSWSSGGTNNSNDDDSSDSAGAAQPASNASDVEEYEVLERLNRLQKGRRTSKGGRSRQGAVVSQDAGYSLWRGSPANLGRRSGSAKVTAPTNKRKVCREGDVRIPGRTAVCAD